MGRGYNHYLNCGCGWCSSTGGNRLSQHELRLAIALADARRELKLNNATTGGSSCFVNPNARCPICQQSVFYYENENGSRVFFDQLGPPWPKHQCTDSRNQEAVEMFRVQRGISVRKRGERLTLVHAASVEGLYMGARSDERGFPIDWQLAEVTKSTRSGWENRIEVRLIEMAYERRVHFTMTSPEELLMDGDVLSVCFRSASIFHTRKMRPHELKVIWYTDGAFETPIEVGEFDIRPRNWERSQSDKGSEISAPRAVLIKRSEFRRRKKRTRAQNYPIPESSGKGRRKRSKNGKSDTTAPKVLVKSPNALKREQMLENLVVERKGARGKTSKVKPIVKKAPHK